MSVRIISLTKTRKQYLGERGPHQRRHPHGKRGVRRETKVVL